MLPLLTRFAAASCERERGEWGPGSCKEVQARWIGWPEEGGGANCVFCGVLLLWCPSCCGFYCYCCSQLLLLLLPEPPAAVGCCWCVPCNTWRSAVCPCRNNYWSCCCCLVVLHVGCCPSTAAAAAAGTTATALFGGLLPGDMPEAPRPAAAPRLLQPVIASYATEATEVTETLTIAVCSHATAAVGATGRP